jgi:flagellar basal-body rod modification protein FlgD
LNTVITSTQNQPSLTQTSSSSTTAPATNDLDKNAFLKLLVTQLENQDPLQPADDTEFISQLAQFSALEQMSNVADEMNKVQQSSSFSSAVQLIGTHVVASGTGGQSVEGIVDGVQMVNGIAKVSIGGQLFDLSQIETVQR